MILDDEEIKERMESPINLMNRLRKASTSRNIPSMPDYKPPTSKDLIPDLDEKLNQIKDGNLRGKAADIMSAALRELEIRIPDVNKPQELTRIVDTMNKVLMSRQDKEESKAAQIIVYAPQVVAESAFEVITVNE